MMISSLKSFFFRYRCNFSVTLCTLVALFSPDLDVVALSLFTSDQPHQIYKCQMGTSSATSEHNTDRPPDRSPDCPFPRRRRRCRRRRHQTHDWNSPLNFSRSLLWMNGGGGGSVCSEHVFWKEEGEKWSFGGAGKLNWQLW